MDHVVGHDAAAAAVGVLHQLGDEPLLVGRDLVLHAHGVERVQDDQAGQVGGEAGAREAGAAERALGDLAGGLVPAEDRAPVLELDDLVRGRLAEDLDRVLVADVVGALDGVEGVVVGGVLGLVAERRVDPALGGAGVAADRVDLRHQGDVRAGLVRGDGRPHPGQTRAHHHDVMAQQIAALSELRLLCDKPYRTPPRAPRVIRPGGAGRGRARSGMLTGVFAAAPGRPLVRDGIARSGPRGTPRHLHSRRRHRPRDRRGHEARHRRHRRRNRLGRAGGRRRRHGDGGHAAARTRARVDQGAPRSPSRARSPRRSGNGFRSVNVALRQALDLYACVRPCKSYEGVRSKYEDIDLVIVRENTEDLYAGIEFEKDTPEARR